jgi:hypothetical protein
MSFTFAIPLSLCLSAGYLRSRLTPELALLASGIEVMSGLLCWLLAPESIQVCLFLYLLVRQIPTLRKSLRPNPTWRWQPDPLKALAATSQVPDQSVWPVSPSTSVPVIQSPESTPGLTIKVTATVLQDEEDLPMSPSNLTTATGVDWTDPNSGVASSPDWMEKTLWRWSPTGLRSSPRTPPLLGVEPPLVYRYRGVYYLRSPQPQLPQGFQPRPATVGKYRGQPILIS